MRKCNISSYLVRQWWIEFNDTYFESRLRMPDRFEIIKSTRILGQFQAKSEGWCIVRIIRMSDYYDRSEHDFKGTLIHEMIHQWQYENHYKVDHRATFKRKAEEINRKGWNISRLTNVTDSVAEGVKERKKRGGNSPVYIFKFTRNGNIPAFGFAGVNFVKRIMTSQKAVNQIKTHPYYGNDLEFYYIKNKPKSCEQFRVNRKRLSNYNLSTYKDVINPVISAAEKVVF